jgi:hypothetical protein
MRATPGDHALDAPAQIPRQVERDGEPEQQRQAADQQRLPGGVAQHGLVVQAILTSSTTPERRVGIVADHEGIDGHRAAVALGLRQHRLADEGRAQLGVGQHRALADGAGEVSRTIPARQIEPGIDPVGLAKGGEERLPEGHAELHAAQVPLAVEHRHHAARAEPGHAAFQTALR